MNFSLKLNHAAWLAVLTFLFLLSACEENPEFGQDLIPDSDRIDAYRYEETLVEANTLWTDSFEVSEEIYSSITPYNLLGSYFDPVFGVSTASFLTEVRLSRTNVDFGSEITPDSLILSFVIEDTYGEFRQFRPLEIEVFSLNQSIELDSVYYSSFPVEEYFSESDLVGSTTWYPSSSDSILRISLDLNYYLDYFLDTAVMRDNDTFREQVKGLYIRTKSVDQGGQILLLNPLSNYSVLSFYYQNEDTLGAPIQLASSEQRFDFLINENAARVAHFDHDYQSAWSPIDTSALSNDSLAYLQLMGGPRITMNLNGLEAWKDSLDYVIVKAELIIPVAEASNLFFDPPSRLSLQMIDNDGSFLPLGDLYAYPTANPTFEYFDGNYRASDGEYRFNVAKHIQEIMRSETENLTLMLMPYRADNAVRPNRLIISKNQIKLSIQYLK